MGSEKQGETDSMPKPSTAFNRLVIAFLKEPARFKKRGI